MLSKAFLLILLFTTGTLLAQNFTPLEVDVVENEVVLQNPFAGGLSIPVTSEVDLNNDGLLDIYVYDRTTKLHLGFLYDGANYRYNPSATAHFPAINSWILLYDYNQDGIADIFANAFMGSTPTTPQIESISVYTAYYENNQIRFTPYERNGLTNHLAYTLADASSKFIYISRNDCPAIDDVDGDGDTDILTFDASGVYVEYYQNQAVEQGFGIGEFIFELKEECWGGFKENDSTPTADLSPVMGDCFNALQTNGYPKRHIGSTLYSLDLDNDCDKELFIGDLFVNNLLLLQNGGDCQQAWMTQQDANFPSYDEAPNLGDLPRISVFDATHDGAKDLLVSSFREGTSETELIWLYENKGDDLNPIFELQQTDFLTDNMIDIGRGSTPSFFDYNADGLLDLIVGNVGMAQGFIQRPAALFLYENTGTASAAKFELVDEDYLDLSALYQKNLAPSFGDLDKDGDLDLLLGNSEGTLSYFENTAMPNMPFQLGDVQHNFMNIDVGTNSKPHIADINDDTYPDLLVGERNGNINYFQNVALSDTPQFEPDSNLAPNESFFGAVDTRVTGSVFGNSAPYIVSTPQEHLLLTGTNSGQLELYQLSNPNGQWNADLQSDNWGNISIGNTTTPALADLDNDGFYEVVVGNVRGGLSLFNTNLPLNETVSTSEEKTEFSIEIFPNPTLDYVYIEIPNEVPYQQLQLQIMDINGLIRYEQKIATKHRIDIAALGLSNTIVLLRFVAEDETYTERLIISH